MTSENHIRIIPSHTNIVSINLSGGFDILLLDLTGGLLLIVTVGELCRSLVLPEVPGHKLSNCTEMWESLGDEMPDSKFDSSMTKDFYLQ